MLKELKESEMAETPKERGHRERNEIGGINLDRTHRPSKAMKRTC